MTSLFRLTVENKENYVLVSRNVFDRKFKVHIKYDIKGSSVDRAASSKEKEKDSPTFKDNDLLNDGRSIYIGSEAKRNFMLKLTKDVEVCLTFFSNFLCLLFFIFNLKKKLHVIIFFFN